MKKTLFVIAYLFLAISIANAGTWCQWSGTEGENCKTTDKSYIRIGEDNTHPVTIDASNLNPLGWYELTITEPNVGADQVKDTEVWGFADNKISLTWTVRDMTDEEIDARDATPMGINTYYIWKTLIETNTLTIQQAQDNLPQELIDAYLARKRLIED